MKLARVAISVLVIALVVGSIIVISSQTNLLVSTRTERFTTTTTISYHKHGHPHVLPHDNDRHCPTNDRDH